MEGGNWTAVAVVLMATNEVESAGKVPESLARTTTRKWMVCSSTMAVWMNAAHRTMGGDIVETMEAGE